MKIRRFHIILDLEGVSAKIIKDKDGLEKFLRKFPAKIRMSILAGPFVTDGVEENPGLSGVVLIDYSHISVHTFSQTNQALVDIFSCKSYNRKQAISACLDYFKVRTDQAKIQVVAWV